MSPSQSVVFASTLNREKCEQEWDPVRKRFKRDIMFPAMFIKCIPGYKAFIRVEGSFLEPLFRFIAERQSPPRDFPPNSAFSPFETVIQLSSTTRPPSHLKIVGLLQCQPALSRSVRVFRDCIFHHGRDCAQFLVTKSVPLTHGQAKAFTARLGIDLSEEGFRKMMEKNKRMGEKIRSNRPVYPSAPPVSPRTD